MDHANVNSPELHKQWKQAVKDYRANEQTVADELMSAVPVTSKPRANILASFTTVGGEAVKRLDQFAQEVIEKNAEKKKDGDDKAKA
jgi:hypothetical protein